MKNFIFSLSLLGLGILGIFQAYSKNSCCFHSSLVSTPLQTSGENAPIPESIVAQTFFFIGSGHQSFAFQSEDGRYVLKLLKFHYVDAEKMVTTCQLAKKVDPYSKIVYLHFPSQTETSFFLNLKDRAFRSHKLQGNKFFFILQEKAITTNQILRKHLQAGEITQAKEKLSLLFEMISNSLKSGIYDRDHNVIHNTGFVGNEPIRIDFGKISYSTRYQEVSERKKELQKIANERIIPWITKYYPSFAQEVKEFIGRMIEGPLSK